MADLKSKLDELHAHQDPIERRMREFERRSSVLGHLKSSISVSKNWVIDARKNYTTEPEDDHVFTQEQIDSVESLANSTQVWLDETLAKQEELKDYEEPVLLIDDMITKGEKIDRLVLSMERKRKLWKPKKVEKEEESSSEEETTIVEEEEEEEEENGEKVTKTKKVYKSKTKKSKSSSSSATSTAEATSTPAASEESTPATEEKEKEDDKENEKKKEEKTNERDEL